MVLSNSRTPVRILGLLLLASSSAMAAAGAAAAQELERATPVLDLPPGEYPQTPIMLGNAELYAAADVRVEHDDNIYAVPTNTAGDVKVILVPRLNLQLTRDAFQISAHAQAQARRYLKYESENSTGGSVGTVLTWRPTGVDRVTAAVDWARLVEDRGEPEARTTATLGPRLLNMLRGELSYGRQGTRFGFQLRSSATRLEHASELDARRDHDIYTALGRLSYRTGGLSSAFGEVFVNQRDFRISSDLADLDRDATTYGARLGLAIDPGGTLRGDVAVGLYHLRPADDRLDGRTGLSAQAAVIYQPTRRLAFTFDAFNGDVATVRSGAQSRVDTRLRLGVQQEAYHNLRWQAGLVYRRSNFIGSGIRERTIGTVGEVEYLVNRRLAIAAVSRFSGRNSNIPEEEFERFRTGLEVRLQY